MMESGDINDRPLKRRRFFVDEEEDTKPSPIDSTAASLDASTPRSTHDDEPPVIQSHGVQLGDAAISVNGEGNGYIRDDDQQTTSYTSPQEREGEISGDTIGQGPTSTIQNGALPGIQEERVTTENVPAQEDTDGFDTEVFISIIGERLSSDTIRKIRSVAGGDLERAINVYFDGSWKSPSGSARNQTTLISQPTLSTRSTPVNQTSMFGNGPARKGSGAPADIAPRNTSQPSIRYVGAFGVGAWATRSGVGFIKHGDRVNIERARSQPVSKRGRGGRVFTNNRGDVLTRFTNQAGQEIGRLPQETAAWVSTLLDQKVCKLEGVCVFAPDRVRVNDTIYLQLWCYLRIEAFQSGMLDSSIDDNRSTNIFEEKESTEEKRLRLRQVALVKLFDEIGLQPTSANDMTLKHKKEGLLRAVEIADRKSVV